MTPTEIGTGAAHDAAPVPAPADAARRRPAAMPRVAAGVGLAAVLLVAGAFGLSRSGSGTAPTPIVDVEEIDVVRRSDESLGELIARLQAHLQVAPGDATSWATLGLAYVQQAKVTVDPSYYELADDALARSLDVGGDDNFAAYTGLSALASARHRFVDAKAFAEQGLEINAFNARLYGALSDAELQLGNYDAAFAAVQRMVDLSPDTASLARASYTWELRGREDRATALMERARDDAPTPADEAFALVHLGELRWNAGDADAALTHYVAALEALPGDPAATAGRARAEAALGQVETALDHYAELVDRAPEPGYILEYVDLLRATGRDALADEQEELFLTVQELFAASGVASDATAILYHADHGEPAVALEIARSTLAENPFITTYDAYGWALHRAGRDAEALAAIERALELGTQSALFHYHAGIVRLALGDADGARRDLRAALDINPHFHPLSAPEAMRVLAELGEP